jgi:ketosteroid isomerase-like protein
MHKSFRVLLAIILIAVYAASVSTATSDEASDKEELFRLEKVWNDAHLLGNADALVSLWADDLVVTVPKMSPMSKTDSLAFLRSGRMKFQKYETSDIAVRLYGDAAVVTGHLVRSRTINDRNIIDDWVFTKVYVRQNKIWRVVSWQASESPSE